MQLRMKNFRLRLVGGGVELVVKLEGAAELSFNRYIGTNGASVASNAEDTGTDTFSGGPFNVCFTIKRKGGRWVVSTEVRHDPNQFNEVKR
jgi:hypothetical protein